MYSAARYSKQLRGIILSQNLEPHIDGCFPIFLLWLSSVVDAKVILLNMVEFPKDFDWSWNEE